MYFRLLVLSWGLRQKVGKIFKTIKERRRILVKLAKFRDIRRVGFNVRYYDQNEVVYIANHYGYIYKRSGLNGCDYIYLTKRAPKEAE